MKVGLDIHGVIDQNPKFFAELSKALVKAGHEVHIITGPRFEKVEPLLKRCKITYTHFFSIVEYEEKRGKAKIRWDKKGDPFMEFHIWDSCKARYCKRMKIDFHLDDSSKYGEHFVTPFAHYTHKRVAIKKWKK
jgi:hypothetical protein